MNREGLRFTGLDLSPNHLGMVTLDIDGNRIAMDYVTGTAKGVKLAAASPNVRAHLYKHPTQKQEPDLHQKDMARLAFARGVVLDALDRHATTHLAIEGYAYSQTGREYQIGELGGVVKQDLWELDIPFRVHDPTALKMFVARKGNADKEEMIEAVTLRWGQEFWHFSSGAKTCPTEGDLSDAYGLAQMCRTEWRMRHGEVLLSGFHPKEIQAFTRTTKANPVNILGREWTQPRED